MGLLESDRGAWDIEWRCTCIFILPELISVFLQVSTTGMHAGRPPSHSAHLAPSARSELSGTARVDRAYSSSPT